MSDIEAKKSVKGPDHVSSKKRAAAALAAAVAASANNVTTLVNSSDNEDGTKVEEESVLSPVGSPNARKRSKNEKSDRKAQKQPESLTTSAKSEDEEGLVTSHVVASTTCDVKEETRDVNEEVVVETEIVPMLDTKITFEDTLLTMCTSARMLASNVTLASKGPSDAIIVTPRPESFVLAMITNDMEWNVKTSKERESAFTAINFVTLKILEAGFNSAPYEKAEGANTKQLVYCDKKGKMLSGKPTQLASVSMSNNVKYLDMKTWEQHPTTMMKTKWRGTPTECVGVIAPGIPLSCNIFNENKDSIMQNETTELMLKPFSLAIIGVVVKSREQCLAGYGIGIKSIRHVEGVNVCMTGLYHDAFFYTDTVPIADQTNGRLQLKTRVKEYDADLSFVAKLVRSSTKNEVSEKPIVCILPSDGAGAVKQHCVHMQPNNKLLELEFLDSGSIYHQKRFRIMIPDNMFTIEETGLPWIQFYMQWLLNANACRIMIVHDEYQFNRMTDGTGSASMHCALVPDESRLFSEKNASLVLSPAIMMTLDERIQGRKNSMDMYTGWVIHVDTITNKTYAVLFDKTKAYGPEVAKPVVVKAESEDADSTAESEVVPVDSDCDPVGEHTSIICRIYKGMNPGRHIWRGYLLTIDNAKNEVERLFQIGIKSKPAYANAAGSGSAFADANIFENCDMLFD